MASVRVFARRCVRAVVPIPRAVIGVLVRMPVTGLLALSALAWLATLMAGNHQPIAQPRLVVMSTALTASPMGGDDGDNGGGGCGGGFGCGGGISSGWAAPGSALSDSGGLSQIPVKTSGTAWHPNDPTGSAVSPRLQGQPAAGAATPQEPSGGASSTRAGMARVLGQLSELMPQIGRMIGRATTGGDAGNVGEVGGTVPGGPLPPGTAQHPDPSLDTGGTADQPGSGSVQDGLARAGVFAIGRASGTAGTVGMTPPGTTSSQHLSADDPADQLGTGGSPDSPWAAPATTSGRPTRADPTSGGSDGGGTPAPTNAGTGQDDWSSAGARNQSLTDTADPTAGSRRINDRLDSLTGPRGPDPDADPSTTHLPTGHPDQTDTAPSSSDPDSAVFSGGRAGMRVPTSDGGTLGITPTDTPTGHASVTADEANNRYLITAQDPQAPNAYHFGLSMPAGSSAQPNRDGGVDVVNAAGRTTQTIAAPWAHDATGAPVPTYFTVQGSTLTQHIQPGPDSVYPILADPAAAKGGASGGGSSGGKGGSSGGGKSGGGGSSSSGSSGGSSSHGHSASNAAHSGSGGTDSSSTSAGSHGHSAANAAHAGSGGTTSSTSSPGSAGGSGRSASSAAHSGSGGTQSAAAGGAAHGVSAANRAGNQATSNSNNTASSGTVTSAHVAPAPGDNGQPGQPTPPGHGQSQPGATTPAPANPNAKAGTPTPGAHPTPASAANPANPTTAPALPGRAVRPEDAAASTNPLNNTPAPHGVAWLGQKGDDVVGSVNHWLSRQAGAPDYAPTDNSTGAWLSRSVDNLVDHAPSGVAGWMQDFGTDTANSFNDVKDMATGHSFDRPTNLPGETPQQTQDRTHPFNRDVRAAGQQYGGEIGPALHGDVGPLRKSFLNDPAGTVARYAPVGGVVGKGLARTGVIGRVGSAASDAGSQIAGKTQQFGRAARGAARDAGSQIAGKTQQLGRATRAAARDAGSQIADCVGSCVNASARDAAGATRSDGAAEGASTHDRAAPLAEPTAPGPLANAPHGTPPDRLPAQVAQVPSGRTAAHARGAEPADAAAQVRTLAQMREPNHLSGSAILRDVRQTYQDRYRDVIGSQNKRVAVVRFEPSEDASPSWRAKMDASRVSAEQKVKNIGALGYQMDHQVLPTSVKPDEFGRVLRQLNEDPSVSGVIVQFPPPRRLADLVASHLDPAKDVDGLLGSRSLQAAPATADGIVRVAEPFLYGRPTVAVVGNRGFIGRGVTNLLREHDVQMMPLELGDDLRQARDADMVISVTGNPRILGPEHLSPQHRLVIDSGFVPQPDGTILSDVQREASSIPQRITPVPGGIGPVEMAVLLDRFVRMDANPSLAPWRLLLPGE